MWGIANIFYTVLTGRLLFGGAQADYKKKLENGTWSIPFKVPISLEGIKFLNQLLVYDPEKRISINELVDHPYLSMQELIPVQAENEAIGELVSVHNQEITFNIKSSRPLEELLAKLRPDEIEKLRNNPIPLDEGFVDKVDQQI